MIADAMDKVGKEGDAHFEVVSCDVHDTRRELKDGNFRGNIEFAYCVEKAVGRDTSVRVNYAPLDKSLSRWDNTH